MSSQQVETMARYNTWMNERLYAVCADIPDEERKRDCRAFFRSIHGTLNHILLADKVWMGRFEGQPFKVDSLDQELFADFDELRAERAAMDARIEAWASALTDDALMSEFRFTSIIKPGRLACSLWLPVTHFFNHQTHHRGQLTTLLSQIGKDYGVTDLIWLPGMIADVAD